MNKILLAQKSELTEYHIYSKLAGRIKNPENAKVLQKIADEEKKHSEFWYNITQTKVKPIKFKIWYFTFIARIFGLTFSIKLMERGENRAQINYESIIQQYPDAKFIVEEENDHEQELIGMIKEKKLEYVGSVVLGLNDALVELTGALAGLTFALQNTRLTALAGLITGIAASFSMAASEYLSNKAEGNTENALASSFYTGIAYILTVTFLVVPYFLFSNMYVALGVTLFTAIFIIFIFNYYISVAMDYNFKRRFAEMAIISLGVAAISFGIGLLVNKFIGVEV